MKSFLAQAELECLGDRITQNGIQPKEEKGHHYQEDRQT
jgi:hypothetical protein